MSTQTTKTTPQKNRSGAEASETLEKKDWRLLRRLFPYLRGHIWLVLATTLFMLIMDISSVLHPYLIKVGIDRNVAQGDAVGLQHTALWLLVVLISAFVFQVLFNYTVQYLGQKLLYTIRLDLFKHMVHLSNDYFDRTAVGKTMTHITNDVESIREFISEGIVSIIGELLKVLFIMLAMVFVNYKLALLSFITIPFFFLMTVLFRRSIRTGYRGVRKANARINTALQESITGIREIIQFNYKERSKVDFEAADRQYLDSFISVVNAYALYFPVIEIVANASMVIILAYAHFSLGLGVHVGEIFAFFAYINMFFRPLRQLAEQFNTFQSAMAASERIFQMLDTPITIKNPPHPYPVGPDFKGKITFQQVQFSYNPDTPVLHDLSFEIQPGEKVAIVGYTGSGKTTIINLISRLYDIQAGQLLIDDVPISQYDLHQLRSRIAIVPQDPFIFTGSVAENIAMFNPQISRAEVIEAANRVNAHTFIQQFPAAYEENVLEEGRRLSVGQKQLLSFARGIVRQPRILILDEATSNVDSKTETLIEEAIATLLQDRTAIIIAHRLSTIRKADRILVLKKGRLVEQGTHLELLKKDGLYSRLYQTQAFSLHG